MIDFGKNSKISTEYIQNHNRSIFEISVEPPDESLSDDGVRDLNLTWQAIFYKDSMLKVQINFTSPKEISR